MDRMAQPSRTIQRLSTHVDASLTR